MSGDAWNERTKKEDKALLAHVIEARRQLKDQSLANAISSTSLSAQLPPPRPGSRTSAAAAGNARGGNGAVVSTAVREHRDQEVQQIIQTRKEVRAPIGSSIVSTRGGSNSLCPSIAPSTQLSHRGASTVAATGTSYVSDLTVFSTRLEKLEQRLDQEKQERKRVYDELAEIKKLLVQQARK